MESIDPKRIEASIAGHKLEGYVEASVDGFAVGGDSDNYVELQPMPPLTKEELVSSIVTVYGEVNGKRTRKRHYPDSPYRIHSQGARVIETATGREGIFTRLKSTLADTTMIIRQDDGQYFEADLLDMEELID